MKVLRKVVSVCIAVALMLPLSNAQAAVSDIYKVQAGQNIYDVCDANNMRTSQIMAYNGFVSSKLYTNQRIYTFANVKYVVQNGDTLAGIAAKYETSTQRIIAINGLKSDAINKGATLTVPIKTPTPVLYWPSKTYIVREGDTLSSIAKKHNVSLDDLMKFNYIKIHEWLNAGEKIAINGYAPRYYSAMPKESPQQNKKVGKLVDFFFDGKYLIRRNDKFAVTDLATGRYIKLKMMGGYHHIDAEPQRKADTAQMRKLWSGWSWKPRPVIIHIRGMNIAASLSGKPHSFDTVSTNGVSGHFDLYLYNSKSHSKADKNYVKQHLDNVNKAAGIK